MPLMNRIWMTLLGTLVICNSAWAGEPSPCTRLHALYPEPGSFSKRFGTTLITGASVSDDFGGVRSPGRRVLEAEIAMERYKNLLLRKNISFPFSPITAKII
ncbi:hypothetical protein EB061_11610, partial [bacterium]|nr:hypothetical protein [bacterium]